ncbi:uncharacterized protein G2W53_004472 [Senna tora]|uniref:Uncharacterized protein n=1 Tax=Senna tora TaxID=362788 RepID=A0A835CHA6_9FABA|nr:uncharacterized protein G2W53_004472 [Senna tora]
MAKFASQLPVDWSTLPAWLPRAKFAVLNGKLGTWGAMTRPLSEHCKGRDSGSPIRRNGELGSQNLL